MKQIEQIILLLNESRDQLLSIKQMYEDSIIEEQFNPKLHPKIKNLLENLRSSFEYMAHIIFDEYSGNRVVNRIQFPISKNFDKVESSLNKAFPNLSQANFELFNFLIQSQNQSPNNNWFRELRDLTNLMKHNELPIQVRQDLTICRITNPNGNSTSWETSKASYKNGQIHMSGGGASVSMRTSYYQNIKDPLELDSYGWKVTDLPLDHLRSKEVSRISEVCKVEYYQAGNFYFNFDLGGKNVYNKLFTYYDNTWRKLNLIYMKIYPDKEKLYNLLFV